MISVIIPLYNKAAHIQRTLDCVLAQTHGDFEIIVVDDGSTDGGAKIVRQCPDPRVRLIQQPNAGVSAARNHGVSQAKAELLSFIDADDEWDRDFLATVLALREKFPDAGVWGTAYSIMAPNGTVCRVKLREDSLRQEQGLIMNYFQAATLEQPIHASSMLVRKDAFLKIGGYRVGLQRLEDTDLLFRLALRYPIAFDPAGKTIYHMDAGNRSDGYLYRGNFPFFKHARDFLNEGIKTNALSEDVLLYLANMHTGGLYRNWLAGDRSTMREIIRDCNNIQGFRLKCFLWRFLAWLPHPWVLILWRLQSRLRGHSGILPPVRSIYR
jgi:glycosyltransferase involved in cell wall biosynthesis